MVHHMHIYLSVTFFSKTIWDHGWMCKFVVIITHTIVLLHELCSLVDVPPFPYILSPINYFDFTKVHFTLYSFFPCFIVSLSCLQEADLASVRYAKDREASLRRAKEEATLAEGISWGMGEDAVEEIEVCKSSSTIVVQIYCSQIYEHGLQITPYCLLLIWRRAGSVFLHSSKGHQW